MSLNPETIVRGCKKCHFTIIQEMSNDFWNYCPTCGRKLVESKAKEFHENFNKYKSPEKFT